MTIAEAIDRLERRYMTTSMGFIGDEGKEMCKRENEAITMAIDALRRHNLMKPIERIVYPDDVVEAGLCPLCNEGCNSEMNYYSYCGQALDWSDVNDS